MKIICIGRNYIEHSKELKNPVPYEPVFFLKADSAILKNNQPFFYPDWSNEIHYEVELVIRIDKLGKNVEPEFAHRYYSEIGLGIDFTARDIQRKSKEKGLPWTSAKAFDGSAPVSSFIAKEPFRDIQNVDFSLELNDKQVQKGNTKDMIFTVDELISHLSKFFTLKIGDLIFTGTPAGVGPVKIGDNLKAYIKDKLMLNFDVR